MTSSQPDTSYGFVDSLGDACLVLDPARTIVAANRPAETLWGRPVTALVGSSITDLTPEEARDGLIGEIALCNGRPRRFSAIQTREGDARFIAQFSAKACHASPAGTVVLTAREDTAGTTAIHDELTLNTLMLNHVTDGIVCHTLEGGLVFANRAALSTWGVESLDAARALGPFGWVSAGQETFVRDHMRALVEQGEARFESHGVTPAGTEAHLEIHASLVQTSAGPVIISSVRDISERIQAEEMVRYLAYHDTLTGLANRVLLESDLAHAVGMSERHGDLVGLLFIDLNSFKPVNDAHGHAVGDLVLREVANRIAGAVRETDTVARPGGDEFVVLLPRIDSEHALVEVARKLSDEVGRPMDIDGIAVTVSAAVGLAVHRPGESAESLLTRADLAMYEARERGLSGWDLFSIE